MREMVVSNQSKLTTFLFLISNHVHRWNSRRPICEVCQSFDIRDIGEAELFACRLDWDITSFSICSIGNSSIPQHFVTASSLTAFCLKFLLKISPHLVFCYIEWQMPRYVLALKIYSLVPHTIYILWFCIFHWDRIAKKLQWMTHYQMEQKWRRGILLDMYHIPWAVWNFFGEKMP